MLGGKNKEDEERQNTPSTTASEISPDENQWIKRPPLFQLYDPSQGSDPMALYSRLTPKELGIISDYVNLWTKNT